MLGAQLIQLPQKSVEHDHNHHQIVLGIKGRTTFELGGQERQVGHQVGCLIPASLRHKFSGIDSNEILVLNVSSPAKEYQGLQGAGLGGCPEIFEEAAFFKLDPMLQQWLQVSARELDAYPEDEALARSFAVCLLQMLAKRLSSGGGQQRSVKRLDMDAIKAYVQSNLNQKMLVRELALLVCMSPSHFFSVFREETGMTPNQYITQVRVEMAAYLLKTTLLPLIDISVQTGFSSQSAFATVFKRYYDMTPRQYRLQC